MAANPFLWLISQLIWLYIYILIASAVLSWLVAFNVINTRNDFVRNLAHFLFMVTEPALRPIRSILRIWAHRYFAGDPDDRADLPRKADLLAVLQLFV